MARKRIGELLLERGAINPAQLEEGLAHQKQTRQRLGVALVQKGFIREDQLVTALSEALRMPAVDLATVQPEWAAIHTLRVRFCETHDLFPYGIELASGRKQLLVAMGDPLNAPAIQEIEFTTGLKVSPRIATTSGVRGAILRYYHKQNPADAAASGGGMTIIQGKGVMVEVPATPEPEDEVIVGEMLEDPEVTAPGFPGRGPASSSSSSKPSRVVKALATDLDYLLGEREEPDPVELLEKRFWALMKIMARKGMVTQEEFNRELAQQDDDELP